MPRYEVTDGASGKTLTLEGDSPPTDSELEDIFAEHARTSAETQSPLEPSINLAEMNRKVAGLTPGMSPWGYDPDPAAGLREIVSDPMIVPRAAMGAAMIPGKIAYAGAADAFALAQNANRELHPSTPKAEYGGNLFGPRPDNVPPGELPVEHFLGTTSEAAPNLTVAAKIGKAGAEMSPLGAVGMLPAWAGRLAAAGFSAQMIASAPELFQQYAEEINLPKEQQNPDKLTTLKSDIIQTFAFSPLAAGHALSPKVNPLDASFKALEKQTRSGELTGGEGGSINLKLNENPIPPPPEGFRLDKQLAEKPPEIPLEPASQPEVVKLEQPSEIPPSEEPPAEGGVPVEATKPVAPGGGNGEAAELNDLRLLVKGGAILSPEMRARFNELEAKTKENNFRKTVEANGLEFIPGETAGDFLKRLEAKKSSAENPTETPGTEISGRAKPESLAPEVISDALENTPISEDVPPLEFNKLMDRRDEIIGSLKVPEGWRIKNIEGSRWKSNYWEIESPEGEIYKIRVGNHSSKPTQHTPNDYSVTVSKDFTLNEWRRAQSMAEEWLRDQAGEAPAISDVTPKVTEGKTEKPRTLDEATADAKDWVAKLNALKFKQTGAEQGKETPPSDFIGMGGAVPSEFERTQKSPTAMKYKLIDQERQQRGLEPLTKGETVSDQSVMDKAMAEIDKNQDLPKELTDELNKKPRSIDAWERAVLLLRKIELRNEYDKVSKEYLQSISDGRESQALEEKLRLSKISDDLTEVETASRVSGSEQGRGLRALRIMAFEDFSLASLETQRRVVKGGAPLTDVERAELTKTAEDFAKANAELEQHIADKDKRIAEFEVKGALDAIALKEKQQPAVEPHVRIIADKIKGYFDTRANAAIKRLEGKLFTLSPQVLADLTDLGVSRILQGAAEFTSWSSKMVEALGDRVKPHLKTVWDASQTALDEHINKVAGNQALRVKRKVTGADTAEQRNTVLDQIKDKVTSGKLDEVNKLAEKLARLAITDGAKGWREVNDAVHAQLKNVMSNWDYRDTMDAISGHGKFTLPSKDAVSKELSDVKSQTNEIRKIQEVIAGEPVKPTGFKRDIPSDVKRRLTQIYNEMKRRFGVVSTTPEIQLRSALQARKTYYENRIKDLKHEIEVGKRTVKTKSPSPTDAALEAKISEYESVKAEHDKIFGNRELTDEQKLKMAMAGAERSAKEYQRRIDEGDFSGGKKPSTLVETPELKAARAQRDALKEQFNELRDLDEHYQREQQAKDLERQKSSLEESIVEQERKLREKDFSTPAKEVNRPADTTLEPLKQRKEELARQIAEAKKKPEAQKYAERLAKQLESLNKQIAEKEAKIATGDLSVKPIKQTRPLSPELEVAKQKLESLNKQLNELRNPAKTPEERALQSFMTRTTNRIAELEARMAKGDFSKIVRRPVVLDRKAMELQNKRERVVKKFKSEQRKYELENRSKLEKGFDFVSNARRFAVLSGVNVLAKLAAYSASKAVTMGVGEVAGKVISKLPGISQISAKAPSEGGGSLGIFSKAVAKGLTQGILDAYKTAKTGSSDLKSAFSARVETGREWHNFFQTLHEVVKSPLRRTAFELSLAKRMEHAARNGADITDPLTQMALAKDAYLDSDHALLLENNRLANGIRGLFKQFEAKSKATGEPTLHGKAAATLGRVEFPILSVPLNYAKQTLVAAFGLVSGSVKARAAFRRGIDTLKTEEADAIMRHLKYGSIGGAMLLYGFFDGYNNGANGTFGGYYQPGEKRKDNQASVGGIRVGDQNISGLLLHNPILAVAQLGHTMGAVAASHRSKKDPTQRGLPVAFVAGAMGLLAESPVGRTIELADLLRDPRSVEWALGEHVKGLTVPQIVNEAAQLFDKDANGKLIRRDPKTIMEHVKTGIPGLRQEVKKKSK